MVFPGPGHASMRLLATNYIRKHHVIRSSRKKNRSPSKVSPSWIPLAATGRGKFRYPMYVLRIEHKEVEMPSVDGLPGCSGNPQGLPSLGVRRLAFALRSPQIRYSQLNNQGLMVQATSCSASDTVRMTKSIASNPASVLINLAKVLPRM